MKFISILILLIVAISGIEGALYYCVKGGYGCGSAIGREGAAGQTKGCGVGNWEWVGLGSPGGGGWWYGKWDSNLFSAFKECCNADGYGGCYSK
ncbi:uncharacterized protein VTP21DRAFT_5323 [Calcarisporiella thermophila]|uniref:uncharacterized protein n=1 Tax=Calcarisporiella thermophila TaxID=911321 RepID=UPI0037449784